MGALQRWDDWEDGLDDALVRSRRRASPHSDHSPRSERPPVGDHPPLATASPAVEAPPLEEVYGPATLAAIERGHGEPVGAHPGSATGDRSASGGWRNVVVAAAAGATVAGLARGLRDPDDDPAEPDEVVEPADAIAGARLEPVTVVLVPGDPAASVAIVRPWLFPAARC